MKKALTTTLSVILIILTTNCEKYVTDFKFDEKESSLVLNAILTPDSIIKINVSKSQVFNPPTKATTINDAEIILYEDDSPLGEPTFTGDGYYIFENHYPKPGSTYKVEVSARWFETVKARTTVPNIANFTVTSHGQVDKTIQDCIGCGPEKRTEFSLSVIPDNKTQWFGSSIMVRKAVIEYDFESWDCVEVERTMPDGFVAIYESCNYRILDTLGYYPEYLDFYTHGRAVKFTKSWDYYYISSQEYESYGSKVYYSAKNLGLSPLRLNLSLPSWELNGNEVDEITFWVDAYDESLFQFLYSRAQAEEVDGDPFAEKVQIYSNVQNGLGIFGAISSSSVTMEYNEISKKYNQLQMKMVRETNLDTCQ